MLEILYRDEVNGKGTTQGGVLANDVDYMRANMLIHQVQRISTAGMMVVNHAAQYFPALKIEEGSKERFHFDKILCDVPCSGDGAIRKIPQKWQKWTCADGTSLHPLQLQIVMRALQLVKIGGLVMYSTCSINPVEVFF
jgi:multisite-specific tRNA:(cytosine-C5)-methyltransferase